MVSDFESDFLEEESHSVFGWLVEQGSTWCVILLSLVVVSSIVICAGGLHSSTHWHTCILQQHALCGDVYIRIYNYNCILCDICTIIYFWFQTLPNGKISET